MMHSNERFFNFPPPETRAFLQFSISRALLSPYSFIAFLLRCPLSSSPSFFDRRPSSFALLLRRPLSSIAVLLRSQSLFIRPASSLRSFFLAFFLHHRHRSFVAPLPLFALLHRPLRSPQSSLTYENPKTNEHSQANDIRDVNVWSPVIYLNGV
ncbi:hypothetical protein MRB53_023829 [Persea americana]|uniref:Uncharacterized protein n=1 Tax=Persea americana TaxID=3435 RepID=A0ACC2LAI6_PERAE|nr:hypothetical protein MRB53_023829 [Persea americana]